MASRFFWAHGKFCASHPWEVIVATLTTTACILTQPHTPPLKKSVNQQCADSIQGAERHAVDLIVMTLIRCSAVLYSYHQFKSLRKLGSNYIFGIAGLFTVFSSFVFTSMLIKLLKINVSDLKDALFFFLLLIDLSKAALLAQFALSATNQEEIERNIAQGLSLLGPTITLDTTVETLVISVGTLSGVHRLEVLSCFACFSALVNYVVFMTFYPACLSLTLGLSQATNGSQITFVSKDKNLVVERVKMIMSVGLVMVHMHNWLMYKEDVEDCFQTLELEHNIEDNGKFMKWVAFNVDHIVVLILLLTLIVKYIFFEDKDELKQQLSVENNYRQRQTKTSQSCFKDQTVCLLNEGIKDFSDKEVQTETYRTFSSTKTKPRLKKQTDLLFHEELKDVQIEASKTLPTTKKELSFKGQTIFLSEEDSKEVQAETYRISPTLDDDDTTEPYLKQQPVLLFDEESKDVQIESSKASSTTKKKPFFKGQTVFDRKVNTTTSTTLIDNNTTKTKPCRSLEECLVVYQSNLCANNLTDEEVILLVKNKTIASYEIEKVVSNPERGVQIRRMLLGLQSFLDLPYKGYDYSKVMGVCCENVIGYMPIPLGVAGPLLLDGQSICVPMATTEGCLVASINRGCHALLQCGVKSSLVADGMTRGPVVRFSSAIRASEVMHWLEQLHNFEKIKESFDATSNYARLIKLHCRIAGRLLFIRFVAKTGDAMGMNMLSKGTEASLKTLHSHFPDLELLSLSGNFCTDKKPAALNWLEGRGKSVVCEAVVPKKIITSILKTNVSKLIDVNTSKNLIGSAMAGSIGGFNAHAANIVTAIFIATGQDPAQNVDSSNCITLMEPQGADLYVSCTMPSIEVGTVGGGTGLPAQAACLEMLGVRGANVVEPGANSGKLARIVCGAVLAGELSLMAALASGDLVKSHLRHNRCDKDRV